MNLLMFGPPGAGKGTQSQILIERKSMEHISSGDLFRSNIKGQTELGLAAKKYIDAGDLVPDEVTIGMVKEKLASIGTKAFILDGFPRTVVQAKALDEVLETEGRALGRVLFFKVDSSVLIGRLTGRRVCKNCGTVYHIEAQPTKVEGVCDVCEGEVVQRSDDKLEAIEHRLNVYEESTRPVKEYYDERDLVVEIDGLGTADEVFARVEKILAE